MTHTAIIGGGAAGMAAAIAAAERGERVTVIERGRKPLKKLGATGNGRGNLLNAGEPVYFGGADFALQVLSSMPYQALCRFLEGLGVSLTREDEGRVYPSSLLAASAVDALRLRADELGVTLELNARVTAIARTASGGFELHCIRTLYAPDTHLKSGRVKPGALAGEFTFQCDADRVIVAAGGAAAPAYGTDGTAYGLLTAFGHKLVPPAPALCALTARPEPLNGLNGQRVRGCFTLEASSGQALSQSKGEALFAQDGVSGIAVMQLSRFASPGCVLDMDLREAVMGLSAREESAGAWLRRRAEALCRRPLDALLTGAAPPALNEALLRMAGLSHRSGEPAGVMLREPSALERLAGAIRHYRVPVTGTRGFEGAQVTAGGVGVEGFDPATMQSRLCPNLYAAGEVLDVDGGCGGYNLMFALASGLLAGGARKATV